jgi:hypothetical protein
MLAVTRAMANDDRAQPADAVLLLGDNFYPSGLIADDLVARIRSNLVQPFCRFIVPTGERFREVASSCALAANDRNPVPLFAVLGNHDYDTAESPALQRHEVARFVANWKMPGEVAGLHEFEAGVSLILFDSELVVAGAPIDAIREALRRSRGPWRILVAHRPMATAEASERRGDSPSYAERVRAAIMAAGVPVQLFLAGHEHVLAVHGGTAPDPPLQIISGAGSDRRRIRETEPRALAEFAALGYVRVDLTDAGSKSRLVVSLYGVHRYPWVRGLRERRLLARWSVDLDGRVASE